MSIDWEAQVRRWSGPSSDTEDQKRNRTENAVREAIQDSFALAGIQYRVFAKGSYKNNTNVRLDSDVDVAVECREFMYTDLVGPAAEWSKESLGISPYSGTYTPEQFRRDVEEALVARFDGAVDRTGNKAIRVREETRSLAADVVPCSMYRLYYDVYDFQPFYHEGIQLRPLSGPPVVNWPQQSYERGVEKNEATGRRYKRIVRAIKRLENDMVEKDFADETPSFLIECLVYNAPNSYFAGDSFLENVNSVLLRIYAGTMDDGDYGDWVEVNGIKRLFASGQRWSRAQAHEFGGRTLDYLESH